MATATLILLAISSAVSVIKVFAYKDGAGGGIGAFCYGVCAWWLYFNSGVFG